MEPEVRPAVFTIGHSTLDLTSFLGLLERAGITAIADVRSSPFSRRFPHFSRDYLRVALREASVKYVFLGRELGGRPWSSGLYCEGVADYEKMAMEPSFLKGIERVIQGSNEHTIALMCSEHNPLDCHRCLLVGRALAERQMPLRHLLTNGKIASQHEIEEKLLDLIRFATTDMFATDQQMLAEAYRVRAKAVAHREPLQEPPVAVSNRYDHAP